MEGGETPENTAALDEALAGFPNAKLQDHDEFKDNQFSGVSQVLNVLYVLLALSVIVASSASSTRSCSASSSGRGRSGCCAPSARPAGRCAR